MIIEAFQDEAQIVIVRARPSAEVRGRRAARPKVWGFKACVTVDLKDGSISTVETAAYQTSNSKESAGSPTGTVYSSTAKVSGCMMCTDWRKSTPPTSLCMRVPSFQRSKFV
jgi:hypothetical protein